MAKRGRPKKLTTLDGVAPADPKNSARIESKLDTPMTVKEVSDWLKVSRPTIARYVFKEGMPSIPIGKQRRFLPREVIAFLRKKGGKP